MGRIGAVYLGEAEAAGVYDQLQQTAKALSPDREIKTTQMAPESIKGRGREPEVKLVVMRITLSGAGASCSGK